MDMVSLYPFTHFTYISWEAATPPVSILDVVYQI